MIREYLNSYGQVAGPNCAEFICRYAQQIWNNADKKYKYTFIRREQERAAAERKRQAGEATGDEASMTSRLLDAKKRAREKLDREEKGHEDDSGQ